MLMLPQWVVQRAMAPNGHSSSAATTATAGNIAAARGKGKALIANL
jgi:hypothetical protein